MRRKAARRLFACLNSGEAEQAAALLDGDPRLAWVRDADRGGYAIHVAVWQARPHADTARPAKTSSHPESRLNMQAERVPPRYAAIEAVCKIQQACTRAGPGDGGRELALLPGVLLLYPNLHPVA